MPDEKGGFGSKLVGLFVERDDKDGRPEGDAQPSGSGKSPADELAELASLSTPGGAGAARAPAGKVQDIQFKDLPPMASGAGPAGGGAPQDFDAVFRSMGMDAGELDRVRKAEELLKSLPEATPLAVKKQIVEASLKAFGFELDKIVLAAQSQKKALDAYVRVNETQTAKGNGDAAAEIESLQKQIAALQAKIQQRTTDLSQLAQAAETRKAQVQKVLDFFQASGAAGQP